MLAGFDPYSDNSPPSASSPSPLGKGSGMGGNAFQHRIPRTALYRWPAAPLPRNAVAAKGGFVVLTIPQPTFGQSGRRKPPSRKVPAVLVRCCCGDRHPPDNSSASRRHERQKNRARDGNGGSHQGYPLLHSALDQQMLGAAFRIGEIEFGSRIGNRTARCLGLVKFGVVNEKRWDTRAGKPNDPVE